MAKKMDLQDVEVWDGNMAASQAMRQAQIDVVAAYPITPSTPIVQNYGSFVADGYIDGEFVLVESEHAAMSGCVGDRESVVEGKSVRTGVDLGGRRVITNNTVYANTVIHYYQTTLVYYSS